jgi:DNA end-binding protein Ku
MARRLIDSLASRWDPRAYEDTFKKSVLAVVHKKERGEVIEAKAGAEQPGRVLDLMEALKATLSHGDKAARVPRRRAARKPRARAAASSGRH